MASYEKRLMRGIDHIHAHPADDLTLDRRADVAALSRFHFARVFRAVTGRPVAQMVRLIRMDRAGVALCYSPRPIAEIAREAGTDRPDFAAFRKGEREMTHPVTIHEMPAHRIAALEHFGPHNKTGQVMTELGTLLAGEPGPWHRAGRALPHGLCDQVRRQGNGAKFRPAAAIDAMGGRRSRRFHCPAAMPTRPPCWRDCMTR